MKRIICLMALCVLVAGPVSAQNWNRDYTIEPSMPYMGDRDPMLRPGSTLNPYEVRDQYGRKVGELEAEMPYFGGDPMFKPGSTLNPYRLRVDPSYDSNPWRD